jgi:hypothetical protein
MRRWLKYGLYAVLVVVGLLGLGIGYVVWKLERSVNGATYDESRLTSVTQYYPPGPGEGQYPPVENNPLFINTFSAREFPHPETKYHPWTRWWWPGNDVTPEELGRELRILKEHGIGGGEVQCFAIGVDPKAPAAEKALFEGFDTASYYQNVGAALEAAEKLGMQVDLSVGTAWPAGGPQITPKDNLETLAVGEAKAEGGKTVEMELPEPRTPFAYYVLGLINVFGSKELVHFYQANAKPVAVLAARVLEDRRSSSIFNLNDYVKLDPSSVQVISDRLRGGRHLVWPAPPGDWMVMAFYKMPSGARTLFGAAQPDPGFVVDHFDATKVVSNYNYLFGTRTGLPKFYGKGFRAIFNDSFEFTVERHFEDDFLTFFKERRGYDVTPYLPAVIVPGYDNFYFQMIGLKAGPEYLLTPEDERIRYDYSLTVSDLFINQFQDASRLWAEHKGLLSRVQAYGIKIDVIKAAGHADVPETEALYAGGSEMFLKIASSGAHLYNRPVVSSESFVHMGMDYMTTPQKIKIGADKLLGSGINHIIYHGTPYRLPKPEYGETGWAPFSSPFAASALFSSNISEADPFWNDYTAMNEYMARCQYLLRQGKPQADVLVYYPFLGFPSEFGFSPTHKELYFNGNVPGVNNAPPARSTSGSVLGVLRFAPKPEVEWLERTWPVLQELENRGLSWDWVNDESLAEASYEGGAIRIRGNTYQGVLLPGAPSIQLAAAENLVRMSAQGARVWVYARLPAGQPGFLDFKENDARIRQLLDQLPPGSHVASLAELGTALDGKPLPQEISYAESNPNLRHIRRLLPDRSQVIFFRNTSDRDISFRLKLKPAFQRYYWFDAGDGSIHPALPDREHTLVGGLGSYGSIFLVAEEVAITPASLLTEMPRVKRVLTSAEILHKYPIASWDFKVEGGDVTGGKFAVSNATLFDWRVQPELKHVSSKGVYSARFKLDERDGQSLYFLDLGKVYFTAAVKVNGQDAPPLPYAPYRANITDYLKAGDNEVEVTITPALRNRLIGKANRGDSAYRQFKGKESSLMPAGLLGPVEVWQVKR